MHKPDGLGGTSPASSIPCRGRRQQLKERGEQLKKGEGKNFKEFTGVCLKKSSRSAVSRSDVCLVLACRDPASLKLLNISTLSRVGPPQDFVQSAGERGRNNLGWFKEFCLENGSSQGRNLALTV